MVVISSRHTVSCPCVRRTEPTTVPRPFHDGRAQPVHRLQADPLLDARRGCLPTPTQRRQTRFPPRWDTRHIGHQRLD